MEALVPGDFIDWATAAEVGEGNTHVNSLLASPTTEVAQSTEFDGM